MRRHQLTPFLVLTLVLCAVPARVTHAQWQVNGAPVCTAANGQEYPTIVSDGAGGAIITWTDGRNGDNDIYAQRLNAAGEPQWTPDGVALCIAANNQDSPTIVSDGAGGAIVTWQDGRNGFSYGVYAQRVNSAGVPQWTDKGVGLGGGAFGGSPHPTIASDGAGGAIVTWGNPGIFAQWVDAAGAPQWTPGGVVLCTSGNAAFPTIVSDGAGGAIVTWMDYRGGSYDIYTQRVNGGVAQWTLDGVALCTEVDNQLYPTIASDGAGGAIVTWSDWRNTAKTAGADIFAQRVDAAGAPQWAGDGVPLCTAEQLQYGPTIAADGAGGAIVTWQDNRTGSISVGNYHVYVQRVSAAGSAQWTADGVALSNNVHLQHVTPTIASDGAGGAIVTWTSGPGGPGSYSIHAQRVDADGAPQWTVGGVALCTGESASLPMIVSDGAGGAIVAWQDNRVGLYSDIYAQHVHGSGAIVGVPPSSASAHFQLFAPFPNPSRNGQLRIGFNLPSSERVSSEVLDLEGKRVRTLATDREFPPGTQVLNWDGRNDAGVGLPNGVYFVRIRVGTHSEARRAILLH
jgi:flagellar hook capping protein FlgD